MPISILDFADLARRHVQAERDMDMDALMATLDPVPHYEFHPLGFKLSGAANVRDMYQQFLTRRRDMASAGLEQYVRTQMLTESGFIEEYGGTWTNPDGSTEMEGLVSLMAVGKGRIEGERVYTSERMLRMLWGDAFFDHVKSLQS